MAFNFIEFPEDENCYMTDEMVPAYTGIPWNKIRSAMSNDLGPQRAKRRLGNGDFLYTKTQVDDWIDKCIRQKSTTGHSPLA